MEVPGIIRLQANHRTLFAVVGAVCLDNTDVFYSMIFHIISHQLRDLLATVLLAFPAGADVY